MRSSREVWHEDGISRRDRLRQMLADLRMPGAPEGVDAILHGVDGGTHELGFVERRENVIFLGPPGVGKTHLAITLAIAAAQSGRRVYYGTLADLITSLEEAHSAGRLHARLKVLTHPALLVVDETGYLPITRTGAMLFFQLMTRRYEHASTVLTSNKGFEEWVEIFGDDVMAAAIDRLVHHCHMVTIRGNSYRMRQHTELWQTLHNHQEPEAAPNRRRPPRQEATTN
jgi:hypothetical protein